MAVCVGGLRLHWSIHRLNHRLIDPFNQSTQSNNTGAESTPHKRSPPKPRASEYHIHPIPSHTSTSTGSMDPPQAAAPAEALALVPAATSEPGAADAGSRPVKQPAKVCMCSRNRHHPSHVYRHAYTQRHESHTRPIPIQHTHAALRRSGAAHPGRHFGGPGADGGHRAAALELQLRDPQDGVAGAGGTWGCVVWGWARLSVGETRGALSFVKGSTHEPYHYQTSHAGGGALRSAADAGGPAHVRLRHRRHPRAVRAPGYTL